MRNREVVLFHCPHNLLHFVWRCKRKVV